MTTSNEGAQVRATPAQLTGVTLGNALEFYDFLVFSFFAVQIGQCFFPATNPQSSLLAALATFGAGFLMRPLGAFVIGGLGDRLGRKPMLILSFSMIGAANLVLALTPAYTTIGILAPIIVIACRLVQGFALGGEVGASTAFLVEVAPARRRGAYVSLQMVGQGMAMLAAGVIGVGLSLALDDAALASWGWRIAMGIGVAIVPIGIALRGTLPETLHETTSQEAMPAFSTYRGIAAIGIAMLLAGTISTYVLSYLTTYAQTVLKLPSSVSFGATVVTGIAYTLGSVAAGYGADRYGRRPFMIVPMVLGAIGTIPTFWLINAWPTPTTLFTVSFLLRFVMAMAALASFVAITEAFPARMRSGGVAVVYAIATSVFGGTTQFAIAWLTGITGDPLAPAWYMFGAILIGLAAMLLMRETAPVKVGDAG